MPGVSVFLIQFLPKPKYCDGFHHKKSFESEFLELMELKHKDVLNTLKSGVLTDETEKVLQEAAAKAAEKYTTGK